MNRRQRRKHLKRACLAYYTLAAITAVSESIPIVTWREFWASQPHRPKRGLRLPNRSNQTFVKDFGLNL